MSKEGKSGDLKGSESRGWRGRLCFNIHHSSQLPAECQGLPGTNQWLDIAYPENNAHFHISHQLQVIPGFSPEVSLTTNENQGLLRTRMRSRKC